MRIALPFHVLSSLLRRHFRKKRWEYFWTSVGQFVGPGFWLDLGGGAGSYFTSQICGAKPVILLDIKESELAKARATDANMITVLADGEHLPFRDQSLATVFCNSVIEHVQHPELLSSEIQRSARTFFVQTPNGRFFAELHSFVPIPFYWLLPLPLRKIACRLFHASFSYIEGVSYVSGGRLRTLFPRGTMVYERWLGMVKSFFVIGQQPAEL